jgi:hypothetical protein
MTSLDDDPKYLLGKILIPVITFLGGLWFGKRRNG